MNEKTFRFDLQSLRAVSVLIVIFYHFNFSISGVILFSGGFIGVDIFFIISGYVIANLILIEIQEQNKFNFIKFFEKRLRRLVPVLYLSLFVIFFFGYFFLLPDRFIQLSKDIFFNVFYLANFYFWDSLQAYGAINGIERPLLHTWSLSVEWQFYIFTSFLFIFFRKYILNNFNLYFIGLFIISFIVNFFFLADQINFNFYFSGSRYWEFLLGVLIRYNQDFLRPKIKEKLNDKKINFILFLSLIYIIIFSISYQFSNIKNIFFIITMFSATFIILMGNSNTIFYEFFKTKILVFIGAISYSLYVWHFPFASFFFATSNQEFFTNNIKIIVLILIFLISIFTYYFIENYFRKFEKIKTKNFYTLLILSSSLLIILSFLVIKNKGYVDRLNISNEKVNFILNYNEKRVKPIDYPIKINGSKKTILILGNSIGGEYFEILKENDYISKKYNIIYALTQIRCLENFISGKSSTKCFRRLELNKENNFQEKLSYLDDIDIVIFKTKWNNKDLKDLPKAINFFKSKGKEVIIVSANPEFKIIKNEMFNPKIKYKNNILVNSLFQKNTIVDKYYILNDQLPKSNDLINMEKEYFSKIKWKKLQNINQELKKISQDNSVKFVNDFDIYCNIKTERCDVIADGVKIHYDSRGHGTILSKPFLSIRILQNTDFKSLL
jgi:peptidoglycan/LPS O-acetylase OafA/YrhL